MKWSYLILEAGEKIGRRTNSAASYKLQLQDAGFVNVVEVRYKWPQNRWPKDVRFRELGTFDFSSIYLLFDLINASLGLTVSAEEKLANKSNRNVGLAEFYFGAHSL